ncbi:MAG TPA: hypothetical protein VE972_12430 [Conexibacter sp.]|nr:hypothetical protein [Conexibacter sp.]
MREDELAAPEAGGIVHARLGRPPQDLLEAVVVLEAWGGVPTLVAFGVGGDVLAPEAQPDPPGARRPALEAGGRESVVAEGVALLVAILAVAAWAGPLSAALGPAVLERALQIALPLTLCLQWMVRSRYLSRTGGMRLIVEDQVPLVLGLGLLGGTLALLPPFGPLAGIFVAVWVGGTVLARRGWGLLYGALVLGEAVALELGAPARDSLVLLAGVTLLGVLIAIATGGAASNESPGRVGRALAAGTIGALLGGVLVGDTSLGWGVHGAFPALALVPSVAGSFWGGYHLWQFHEAIPRELRGIAIGHSSGRLGRGPAGRIVVGALARLLGVTVVLSGLVLGAATWTRGTDHGSLFVAFGCAALVCLFVSLHESLGYLRWACFSAAAGLAAELAVQRWFVTSVPGMGLIVGGTLGTLLALVPLLLRLRSSSRVLATALWIK